MTPRTSITAAAILGALAVATGAFGAHGLRDAVAADDLAIWETAARYQIHHAIALLLCGLLDQRGIRAGIACQAFLWGTIVFSGSLYLLVLTGARWLGAITPIGGATLIAGWIALAVAAWRRAPGDR